MSEKRFVIKSTATELELYDDDVQIGEFPHFEWVAKSVDYVVDLLNEQQVTIKQLQDKLFAMQHTIDNQENAIFHLKYTDDNLRKKNIRIEELSKVVHNLKMVLSSDDEQVAKIVGEQQDQINYWKHKVNSLLFILGQFDEENKELKQQLDKIPPRIKEIWLNG